VKTRSILGVWTLALACAAGAILIVATSDHTNDKLALIVLAVPIELAFVASGLVARAQRPHNRTGSLLMIVGFSWFLGALPAAGNEVVFTAGLVLGTLFTALLAHLLLAFPTGELTSRTDRAITIAFYAVALVGPTLAYLFDAGDLTNAVCDGPCPDNLLSVWPHQTLANVIAIVYALTALALALLVLVRLVQRWRGASPPLRRALAPVFVTAALLIGIVLVQTTLSFFSQRAAEAVNWVVLAALLTVPLSFLYGLLRSRFGATTRRLVAELSGKRRPEEVQEVLRRALRDPTLELGYVSTALPGYVDVAGEPLRLPEEDGDRVATRVGEELVIHDASLQDQPELEEVLDAARIAIERGLSLRSLAASERRARALIDAVPDNVFRVRADGTFLDAHVKRNVDVLGGAEAFIGRTIEEVMPPEVARNLTEVVERVLATGEPGRAEYALAHEGGRSQIEARVVRAAQDEVVAITRDVTDLKENEEEQAALRRVAVAVAKAESPEVVFDVVTEEVARLLGADAANLVRFADLTTDEGLIVGKWSEPGVPIAEVGTLVELDRGPLDRVRLTGRPARGGLDDPDMSPRLAARLRELGVTALIAAPITVSDSLWGAVVVSVTGEKKFGAQEEERIGQFANLVAVALANAEAREALAGLAEEQAALSRVAVAVATGEPPERLFNTVSEEVGRLLGARAAATVRYLDGEDAAVIVGGWNRDGDSPIGVGARRAFQGGAIEQVYRTGQTARIDLENVAPEVREHMAVENVSSGVAAPIVVSGKLWGATSISISPPDRFAQDAEARLGTFTRLVAVALANAEAREQLTASRARIVQAGDAERRRLERNLHDGAQQRLVSLALALRLAQAKLPADPGAANELLDRASDELAVGLAELRELARGIHPAILTDRGLAPAVEALAARATLPVEVNGLPSERLPEPIEAAVFYVVAESLTNVSKYASARSARVELARDDGLLVVEVADDGVGGADASKGSGLRGLADRVEALGGNLQVSSEAGRGTTVRAELPVL